MHQESPSSLANPLIGNQRVLATEFAFSLGVIPTLIRVRLYRDLASQRYSCEQSHYIQTPLQREPTFESADDHPSVDACLQAITDDMTEQYRFAEAAGHTPSEDWLLPSRDFD